MNGLAKLLTIGTALLAFSNSVDSKNSVATFKDKEGFSHYYISKVEQEAGSILVEGEFFTHARTNNPMLWTDPAIEVAIDMNDDGVLDRDDEYMLFRLGLIRGTAKKPGSEELYERYKNIDCAPYGIRFGIESRHLHKNVKVTYWENIETIGREGRAFEPEIIYYHSMGHRLSKREYERAKKLFTGNVSDRRDIIPNPRYREVLDDVRRDIDYYVDFDDEMAYVYGVPYVGAVGDPYVWIELEPLPKEKPKPKGRMK